MRSSEGTAAHIKACNPLNRTNWLGAKLRRIVLSSCLVSLFCTNALANVKSLPLADLRQAISIAISDVRKLTPKPPHFLIKSIELELKGTSSNEVEGGFSIEIFGYGVDLGESVSETAQDKLALTLTPARALVVGGEPRVDLKSLVKNIRATFKKVKGETDLIVGKVSYERTWTLQFDAKGKVNFVIAHAGAGISNARQQKITFTLCETRDLRTCAAQTN